MAMQSKLPPPPSTWAEPDGGAAGGEDPSTAATRPSVPSGLPVNPGQIIEGKYRVDRMLGRGGMGIVLAAHDIGLDRPVAIKLLHRASPADREFSGRFRREARAMAKLTNEHFVRVLDIGELPTGEPFLVMEQLEGTDLAALVEKRGPLPVSEVADYVVQACEAIAEAHSIGIVHRDLKPSNMYLARRPDGTSCLKVLDFGIAKMPAGGEAEAQQALTHTTAFLGSPAYMSPEQLLCARDVGPLADVWSLGAILHKLLTAQPPFVAPTIPQVCSLIIASQPTRARDLRADVPRELEDTILRCLRRHPEERFRDVAELARALSPFAPSEALASIDRATSTLRRGLGTRASQPDLLTTAPAVATPAPATPARSSWRKTVAVLAVCVVVGAVGAFLFGTRRGHDARGQASVAVAPATIASPPPAAMGSVSPVAETPASPAVAPVTSVPSSAPQATASASPAASSRAQPAPSHRAAPRAPRPENAEFGGRK
jgi:serine/threonine-protein kinase